MEVKDHVRILSFLEDEFIDTRFELNDSYEIAYRNVPVSWTTTTIMFPHRLRVTLKLWTLSSNNWASTGSTFKTNAYTSADWVGTEDAVFDHEVEMSNDVTWTNPGEIEMIVGDTTKFESLYHSGTEVAVEFAIGAFVAIITGGLGDALAATAFAGAVDTISSGISAASHELVKAVKLGPSSVIRAPSVAETNVGNMRVFTFNEFQTKHKHDPNIIRGASLLSQANPNYPIHDPSLTPKKYIGDSIGESTQIASDHWRWHSYVTTSGDDNAGGDWSDLTKLGPVFNTGTRPQYDFDLSIPRPYEGVNYDLVSVDLGDGVDRSYAYFDGASWFYRLATLSG
jgi:hypothetical protein